MGLGGCGRVCCTLSPENLKQQFQVDVFEDEHLYRYPSYNVSPSHYQVVMYYDPSNGGKKTLRAMKWGQYLSYWISSIDLAI